MGAAQHAGIFLPAVRVIALGLALLVANLALAAPPDATSLFPAGGTIGSTVSVTATGTFNAWPVRILCSEPLVQVECDKTKGKLTINIPQETPPGVVWLRFVDDEGASAPRPFIVSSLPSLLEKEPNNTPVQAQALTSSSVIDGKFDKSGDVDVYRVELEAGQTLVASLLAHQILGSAADGALQICSAEGDVLAMNQDASGLDPLLTFKAPAAGTYLVRAFALPATPNSSISFAGGDLFFYRLTITTEPYADSTLPMAVTRSGTPPLRLQGWNVPDAPVEITEPGKRATTPWFWAPPQGAGLLPLQVTELPVVIAETSATTAEGQPIPVPCVLSGRILQQREIHRFTFEGKKGTRLALTAEAVNLGYDLDPHLKLVAADGKVVAEADDVGRNRDPALNVTLQVDGQYTVELRDVHRTGGPRHTYRLTIDTPQPQLAISVASGSFQVEAGKTVEIPVTINRQNSYSAEVRITAVDLPEGVSVVAATSQNKGDTAKSVKLVLEATAEAKPGPIRIVALEGEDREVAAATYAQTLGGTNFQHSLVWLAVKGSSGNADKP